MFRASLFFESNVLGVTCFGQVADNWAFPITYKVMPISHHLHVTVSFMNSCQKLTPPRSFASPQSRRYRECFLLRNQRAGSTAPPRPPVAPPLFANMASVFRCCIVPLGIDSPPPPPKPATVVERNSELPGRPRAPLAAMSAGGGGGEAPE
jgi:hypothetical protein